MLTEQFTLEAIIFIKTDIVTCKNSSRFNQNFIIFINFLNNLSSINDFIYLMNDDIHFVRAHVKIKLESCADAFLTWFPVSFCCFSVPEKRSEGTGQGHSQTKLDLIYLQCPSWVLNKKLRNCQRN